MTPESAQPRILIVEDEAVIGLDLKRLLIASGYQVTGVASTADRAISAIETAPPDLVLMDIHLEGSADGIDTAKQIRDRFRLPVIFVTAHAEPATLERARQAQPFGYIVKPISPLSLTCSVDMAIHKHHSERELEESRAWLAAVLQSIPDAVCVADLTGSVRLLNSAAETLLRVRQADVLGQRLDTVLPLTQDDQRNLASQLLEKAKLNGRATFPWETLLSHGSTAPSVPVEGEIAISYADRGHPVGAVFALRDISRRTQEESILRQEERMLALGFLASSIARDFVSLLTLVGVTSVDLTQIANRLPAWPRDVLLDKADTIQRVSSIGLLIAEQLTQLNASSPVRAIFVSASEVVASVDPLLNKLSPPGLQVDIHLTDESTVVLCHPDRLQTLVLNIFLNACERIGGSGRVRISTSQEKGKTVLLLFDIEHVGISDWKPFSISYEADNPQLSLSIAHAIVAAMEGTIKFTPLSDLQARLEIRLPLRRPAAGPIDDRKPTVVLLIGSDLDVLGKLEEALESARLNVIRCLSASEALLIGQLYDHRIDYVIVGAQGLSSAHRRKLHSFFLTRSAETKFIHLVSRPPADEEGWQQFPAVPESSLAERLTAALSMDIQKSKDFR